MANNHAFFFEIFFDVHINLPVFTRKNISKSICLRLFLKKSLGCDFLFTPCACKQRSYLDIFTVVKDFEFIKVSTPFVRSVLRNVYIFYKNNFCKELIAQKFRFFIYIDFGHLFGIFRLKNFVIVNSLILDLSYALGLIWVGCSY